MSSLTLSLIKIELVSRVIGFSHTVAVQSRVVPISVRKCLHLRISHRVSPGNDDAISQPSSVYSVC